MATLHDALVALAETVAEHELVGASYWFPVNLIESGQATVSQVEAVVYEPTFSKRDYTVSAVLRYRVADGSTEDSWGALTEIIDPDAGLPALIHADRTLGGAVVDARVSASRPVEYESADGALYLAVELDVRLVINKEA